MIRLKRFASKRKLLCMEIILYKPNKQNYITLIKAFTVILFAISSFLIIYFKLWPFSQTVKTQNNNYQVFSPTGDLASAINTLPTNRDLAFEKLSQIKAGLSPSSDARRLYILAQINQRSGKLQEAFDQYSNINLNAVPYLADRVLLHKAEIASELGQEKAVLEFCRNILRNYGNSLSVAAAHYELGRSYLRQSKFNDAKAEFEHIQNNYASSQQAIGALFYLGQLANQKNIRNSFWENYLSESPDGRFATEIINIWQKEFDELSNNQKSLIGLVYYKRGNKEQALKLLPLKINAHTWLATAETLYKANQKEAAQKALLMGLNQFNDSAQYLDGIAMFLRNASKADRDNLFGQVLANTPAKHKAYVMWRWANNSSKERKQEILLQLERQYPNSIWAGKASAEIFWNAYKNGQSDSVKTLGLAFIKNYGNSPEAAKVRFWLAKKAESEGETEKARGLYNQILISQPTSYYAFRAQGRLKALAGKQDSGWAIGNGNWQTNLASNWVWPLPKEELRRLHPTLQELFSLNLWQEALTLMPSDYAQKLPALHAWLLAQVEEKTIQAIKVAADEIYKRRSNFETDHDYWLIGYPFLYSQYAFNSAQKYNFDPLLVLALIRQESRFEASIVSSAKAIGLCQLMPATAKEVARSINYPAPDFKALCNPAYNIELGSKYLSGLLKQFNGQGYLAVAAYNAGPGSVSKWLKNSPNADPDWFIESIPFQETQKYVINVFENYWVYSNLMQKVYTEKKFAYSNYEEGLDYPSTIKEKQS